MNRFIQALTSRTFWTVAVIFAFNGFQAISGMVPADLVVIINGLLGIAAAYFKVNPSQPYGK